MRAGTLCKSATVSASYCENPLRICVPALRAIRMGVLLLGLCVERVAMSQTMPEMEGDS